ncbi:Stage II sporulation protein M [Desulfofundulus thermosubterraneus DSM 16057]|uniref:Stage II sporulation protein M n=1 Tax=Desulfofundulus thermosubterraneus DSM 16057 TaxID=1121432 RepID=A0A1M6H1M9_9FIRM|nr:Stage II sporulation protein M [Desulfofundulus thermosubterraneus DSM 16057]
MVPLFKHRLPGYVALYSAVFVIFLAVGYILHHRILAVLMPSVNASVAAVGAVEKAGGNLPAILALAIFVKNALVAVLVLTFGKRLFGAFPAFVLAVNALVLGAVYGDTVSSGTPWSEAALYFVPHGVIEIPALVAACVLAVRGTLKERLLNGAKYLAVPLALAALVEVYVTPALLEIVWAAKRIAA